MFCCHVSLLSSNLRQFLGLLGGCQAALSFLLGPQVWAGVWGRGEALAAHPGSLPKRGVAQAGSLPGLGHCTGPQLTGAPSPGTTDPLSQWTTATSDQQSWAWEAAKCPPCVACFLNRAQMVKERGAPPELCQDQNTDSEICPEAEKHCSQ